MTPELIALGKYLAGEFDNQPQAMAEPVWYVHLRLWLRPVPLFTKSMEAPPLKGGVASTEDSLTLFAEQASMVNLDRPYRPRLLRLCLGESGLIEVRHYMFEDIESVKGAGRNLDILKRITVKDITFLPTCTLAVTVKPLDGNGYHFTALPKTEERCQFTYQGITYQVALGFEVTADSLATYDKGIDPSTGKGIWGALMGAYRYQKREDFSGEFFG